MRSLWSIVRGVRKHTTDTIGSLPRGALQDTTRHKKQADDADEIDMMSDVKTGARMTCGWLRHARTLQLTGGMGLAGMRAWRVCPPQPVVLVEPRRRP